MAATLSDESTKFGIAGSADLKGARRSGHVLPTGICPWRTFSPIRFKSGTVVDGFKNQVSINDSVLNVAVAQPVLHEAKVGARF